MFGSLEQGYIRSRSHLKRSVAGSKRVMVARLTLTLTNPLVIDLFYCPYQHLNQISTFSCERKIQKRKFM